MASDPIRSSHSHFQAQAELEMLQLIIQQEPEPYPWNPAEPESSAYFAALEQEVIAAGWSEGELTEQGQILAQQFDNLWATVLPTVTVEHSVKEALSADLFEQFLVQVPQPFLDGIVQRARQLIAENLTMADKLVRCVQDALPNWGEDDLQVLARPFAYAMRGAETEMLEVALRSVRCAAWTELSGIEQARLSLAIARYALAQMPSESVD
ncbi:hypothetical protein IQ268_21155 [Oculatella sp. LEGE 06141]|uniref:hypothetical protein n=1 Tax=Oculatella sp. LEGE 06141 TaxID=1828648 RepID=UPI00187F205F|nr:hypothetical protein [Oculatella sp. LEGE 06141]MBE9181072.1 hypothetical protein [Oculatella sp. LEGE 06141]